MGLAIGAGFLWVATIIRLVATVKRPDPARITMTTAAVCVSLAFTVGALGASFDETLHWPNGAELVSHLLFTTGAYFTLLFLHVVRHGQLPRSVIVRHSIAYGLVMAVLLALFGAAGVDDQSAGARFASVYVDDGAAVLYRIAFSAYFVYCLATITRTCRRHAFADGDKARSLSLCGIGIGAALAAIASVASALQMALSYLTGRPAPVLATINVVGVGAAGIIAGIGVLVPIPLDTYLRWHKAHRISRDLEPLWRDLTTLMPDLVLSVPPGPNPLEHAEMISARRRIEIADALARIHLDPQTARDIQHSPSPPAALGRALRNAWAWKADEHNGIPAAELLPDAEDDDLGQLLSIAGAYGDTR